MLQKSFKIISLSAFYFIVIILVSGCTPWDSKFRCPRPPLGECQSVEDSYKESLWTERGSNSLDALFKKLEKCKPRDSECKRRIIKQIKIEIAKRDKLIKKNNLVENLYLKNKAEVLTKLLKAPPVPLRYPPKIVRIYILPYTDQKKNLVMGHHVYFTINEGKWVLESIER